MKTVRQVVQALADGQISTRQAVLQLLGRTEWDLGPASVTDGQLFGVDDLPPPGDNSPDQINLVPGLDVRQRQILWQAVEEARDGQRSA